MLHDIDVSSVRGYHRTPIRTARMLVQDSGNQMGCSLTLGCVLNGESPSQGRS